MNKTEINKLNHIVKTFSGSLAYGTNIATSDTDYRGIFCADESVIRSPFFNINEVCDESEEDTKLYELSNFMKLYVDMNPNILELLWVRPQSIVETSEAYQYLVENRNDMLSKKVAFTFTGYASQQLKRIKGHNKWLNNPQPIEPPNKYDYFKLIFSFNDNKKANFKYLDQTNRYSLNHWGDNLYSVIEIDDTFNEFITHGVINSVPTNNDIQPLYVFKFCDKEYRQAQEQHKNYWSWSKNRNVTRHATELEHGYDTKHAMHIVRLMRMGKEILEDGVVNVYRPDHQELLDIRNGKWSLTELLEYADYMDDLVRNKLYKTSFLPKTVDLHKANNILLNTQDICWSGIDK